MKNEFKYEINFNPKEVKKCKDSSDVLELLKQNNEVEFVRIFFSDLAGNLQSDFSVPKYCITEQTLKDGFGYDGSSVLGQSRIQESDKIAVPIAESAMITPWKYNLKTKGMEEKSWRELIMFSKLYNPNRSRYEGDVRYVLEKTLEKAEKDIGVNHMYIGPELEYFLFKANGEGRPVVKDGKPETVDHGSYFKGGLYGEVRKESQLILQAMGYECEYDHHEVAPSQHETNFKYLDALDMADFIMLYKYVLRKVAKEHGLFASFMPKPIKGENGSGMHTHQSLFQDNKNIFFDKSDKSHLSVKAKQYMAGLMEHLPEITSVLNPSVNSFKRLVPGYEAPVYICWDPENRSNLIRIPMYDPEKENALRLELRSPDTACNPYLAFAVMLSAGLKGISKKYSVPEPIHENVYEMNEKEREKRGIKSLPGSLEQAINLTEKATIVRETLGEHLYNSFIENKIKEIQELKQDEFTYKEKYREKDHKGITNYELEKLLPVL
ncbi:MAG: type I glutamate--ammonia ligase [Candidatus Nanoarchaeia archaeon]|nr:type I glutamate--ammonia ligase [Candidatus Nanoarchaeia archaeon]